MDKDTPHFMDFVAAEDRSELLTEDEDQEYLDEIREAAQSHE